MKNKSALAFLFLIFSSGTAFSQNFNKAKLDSLFNLLSANDKSMSSLTLSRNGKVIYNRIIGYSTINDKVKKPATAKTRYRIGTVSTLFTAAIIFRLIEEEKITTTTPLDSFFPKLPDADKITIGDLLDQRSGLHDFTLDNNYNKWAAQAKTEEEMLAIITRDSFDYTPNVRSAYNPANYLILGYIIEKISKQSYASELDECISSELGLKNTYAGGKINVNNDEAVSYKYDNGWQPQPESELSVLGGSGSIVSNPTDMVKFMDAIFSFKLVSKSSVILMTKQNERFGMGMQLFEFYNKECFGQIGNIDGFSSILIYIPDDSLTVAYCSNGQRYPINSILTGALSIYFGENYTLPDFKKSDANSAELDKYLGIYSNFKIPLIITITKADGFLLAQVKDQNPVPLELVEKNKFKFDPAGISIEFDTDNDQLILNQGGGTYKFARAK